MSGLLKEKAAADFATLSMISSSARNLKLKPRPFVLKYSNTDKMGNVL